MPAELAKSFMRAKVDHVAEMLETLVSLGKARELKSGKFTAARASTCRAISIRSATLSRATIRRYGEKKLIEDVAMRGFFDAVFQNRSSHSPHSS